MVAKVERTGCCLFWPPTSRPVGMLCNQCKEFSCEPAFMGRGGGIFRALEGFLKHFKGLAPGFAFCFSGDLGSGLRS